VTDLGHMYNRDKNKRRSGEATAAVRHLRDVLYGSGSAYVVFFLCIYLPEKSQIPVLYGAENTPILALVPLCPKPVLYKIRGFFASPFS
jgi:hypothetical protein